MADDNTTDTTDTAAADDSHQEATPADRLFGDSKAGTPDGGGPDKGASDSGASDRDGNEDGNISGERTDDGGGELRFPEGVEVDQQILDDFKATTGAMGLTNSQSQQLVDLQAQLITRQQEIFSETLKGWNDSVKGDREIGGRAFEENVDAARKALSRYGTPGLRDILNSTGMGSHPEVVRAFVRIGKAMGDGRFVSAGQQAGRRSAADTFYENTD